jgi:hypothetical protein
LPAIRATRRVISAAARREKVKNLGLGIGDLRDLAAEKLFGLRIASGRPPGKHLSDRRVCFRADGDVAPVV